MKEKKVINLSWKNTMIIVVLCFLVLFIGCTVIDSINAAKYYNKWLNMDKDISDDYVGDFFVPISDMEYANEFDYVCKQISLLSLVFYVLKIEYIFLIVIFIIIGLYNYLVKRHNLENAPEQVNENDTKRINNLVIAAITVFIFFGIALVFSTMSQVSAKPIIYLYPTSECEVDVKLGHAENLTCSYPKYEDKWSVLAKPNGDLVDKKSNRNLYSLYYESNNIKKYKMQDDGFVVEGKDVAKFLEEKLEILGLNERESEEFIIYWLPVLEANKYNYIRFATKEEIEENMPIDFSVKPDSVIRVVMTFKGLNKKINVKEQELKTPERTGFTVVEWGGAEI